MIFESMSYSESSITNYYKLPPIITIEADREFHKDINTFIDTELTETNRDDQEQRYHIYKAVFNKVIEHVTAYKPVLTHIQKEYEDTIEAIKNGQQETAFLQEKIKAMASEPSTLRNYKKRADELEERVAFIKKDNEKLKKELWDIQAAKVDREKIPQILEVSKRTLKKDARPIPGFTLEKTTDMTALQNLYKTLDRQLKEINNSIKTRLLPKTNKVKLKKTLDHRVTDRDQLLWQSQVYKARVQKLKIALEASQAYNQVKPPHQTVGDAVALAFQQASGMLKAEREKAEGEQTDVSQPATLEDDDPEMEQEAEMMLEYIEKFNELFEDGLYEEAAVHAANSPKGILRTQATLAKFRDVKIKSQGRSPLLAFCDVMMSSVKAAGSRPNEALSRDCVETSLNENRLDLVYHWLAQDRLIISYQLGKMIADHCSCLIPCMCGCQAMAQNVFIQLKAHEDVIFTMLKQGKVHCTLQYARLFSCVTSENVKDILRLNVCQDLVNGLMEADLSGNKPYLNLTVGKVLLALVDLDKPELASNLVRSMLMSVATGKDSKSSILSIQRAIALDRCTTREQWSTILQFLNTIGQEEISLQLLAITTVLNIITRAWGIVQEDKKAVSFSLEIETCSDSDSEEAHDDDYNGDSSCGLSSRSRESNSYDRSSGEMTPDVALYQIRSKQSILKKRSENGLTIAPGVTSPGESLSPPQKKRVAHVRVLRSPPPPPRKVDNEGDDSKRPVSKGWGGIRFMENDPYTSNPESGEESDTD